MYRDVKALIQYVEDHSGEMHSIAKQKVNNGPSRFFDWNIRKKYIYIYIWLQGYSNNGKRELEKLSDSLT